MPRAERLPRTFDELVRLCPPQAIHDEVGYDNTQEMIDRLTSIPELSAGQARYLDTLAVLLSAYEDEHHEIDTGGIAPRDVLKALLAEHAMTASALGTLLGDRALGSRILSGERELSKGHIRKLAAYFHVSPAVFF